MPTVLDVHDDPEKDYGANGRLIIVYDISNFKMVVKITLKSPYNEIFFPLPSTAEPGVFGSK